MRRAAILLLIVFAACKSKPDVPALRQALKSNDVKVRRAAAIDLGHTHDPAVVDDILKASINGIEQEAADALAEIGNAAEPRLLAALAAPSSEQAKTAARALAAMKSEKGIDALIGLATTPNGYSARTALATAGGAKPLKAMMERAQGPDPATRKYACETLGAMKARDAAPLLVERLGDQDPEVATAAADALGRIGDARAQEPLLTILHRKVETHENSPLDRLQSTAGTAIGRLGPGAVPALLAALDDRDAYVRSYAALGLAEARDARAIPALVRHLGDPYEAPSLSYNLGQALNKIGPQGVTAVLDAAKHGDEQTRDAAVNALGNSDDPRAFPALLEMLHDKSHTVRTSIGFFLAYKPVDARGRKFLADALQKKDLIVIAAAMPYYVDRGIPGSEPLLIEAMNDGPASDLTVAGILLNSGNPQLEAAARKWAEKQGFTVKKEKADEGAIHQRWGSAR